MEQIGIRLRQRTMHPKERDNKYKKWRGEYIV
jgi:hypothetical protein